MKNLVFVVCLVAATSCQDDSLQVYEQVNEVGFYDLEDRIGFWVNLDRGDTLQFLDDENLIRRGDYYNYEEYQYVIEGSSLYIQSPGLSSVTSHTIESSDEASVTIRNMYITNGFSSGSGRFMKIP